MINFLGNRLLSKIASACWHVSVQTTILHVIIISLRFWNYTCYTTSAVTIFDIERHCCHLFSNDIYRRHTVSNESSYHCNFPLACADYVCRCLPLSISSLWKPMCYTDHFLNYRRWKPSDVNKQKFLTSWNIITKTI